VNAKQAHADLNLLERWATEGRIVLERSEVFLRELKGSFRVAKAQQLAPHQPVWELGVPGRSELGLTTPLAGPDVGDEVTDVLFPTTAAPNSNQLADVEHLREHVIHGADVFVTLDEDDFIRGGKRERLQRQGIWVFTPAEVTRLLIELYGWDA
jgi:hypothetical protein